MSLVTGEHQNTRASGLLLHVTSLPGRFGIGDLGPQAHSFVSSIARAGQRFWQVLPIGPTGYGNSPYSSLSTFAGNPLLINPDSLSDVDLIESRDRDAVELPDDGRVDFGAVYGKKAALLRTAAGRFPERADAQLQQEFAEFKQREGPLWLDEYCLYAALKDAHGGRAWTDWEKGVSRRDPTAMEDARRSLRDEVEGNRVVQFLFFEQWNALRETARSHGVALVGDLPLYVAHDSADVWANHELFLIDDDGRPTVVAGVPPDYFSAIGQRWGNPIFDWERMASHNFQWWRDRVRHALALFDVLRIDHFRGIAGYWEIPANEATAVTGRWRPGPAEKLLGAIRDDVGELPFVAEDLGQITADVIALRDTFALPGMRVAQFGFDKAPDSSIHHPSGYPVNVWAYTGTHDNNTTKGWFWENNPGHRVWRLKRRRRSLYRHVEGRIPWGLLEMVARSQAITSVFPVQDILELGAEARMNTPGTTSGNWEWRLQPGQLTDDTLVRLLDLTEETGRRTVL